MNWQQRYTEHFMRPWSERRGIDNIDHNSTISLVRVPLDRLSDALAASAIETHRGVLGAEIELPSEFGFAYQVTGHAWSIMIRDITVSPNRIAATSAPTAAQLSQVLGQPVITLSVSDTSGVIEYQLFEGGEISEYFLGTDGAGDLGNIDGLPAQRYVLSPYSDVDPEATEQIAYFWSKRRVPT
ncbi:hypothetical protein IQ241_23715 [Romeria aff. gracilis LEGE 07310]|uniref:Uncharacterized protein n=1 Tax=Vasconcelosia minhoensis LEGE 07310 TaxID=915328 RepID=A0A8J7DDU8_9CYAN|nr:hypothetical protein [Romeria gracilis]MBE9080257.1 hypothetical protein [Romeria aff. gracilis LEGE 07310]